MGEVACGVTAAVVLLAPTVVRVSLAGAVERDVAEDGEVTVLVDACVLVASAGGDVASVVVSRKCSRQ